MKTLTPLAVAATLAIPALAAAQTVTYEALVSTGSAMDITPDGRYVVGSSNNGTPYRLDCTTSTMQFMSGGNDATAVSDDGTVIVGCMPDPDDGVEVAARWTEATGWVSLGWLPDSLNCPSRSNAYEVSADGNTVVGLSWDGCSGRGFVWTEATGMLELEPLANGSNRASVISSDGTVVGGFAQGSFSRTPAMWNGTTTAGELLDPPNGDVVGEVQGMSQDGSVLLGNWDGDAFMWTEGGGMEVIAQGSVVASWTGIATDIADNGMIIGFDIFVGNRTAWLLPPGETHLVRLLNWSQDHGADIPQGQILEVASACSQDGRTIVGHNAFTGAWKVTIEYPVCVGDIDESGDVGFNDLVALLAAWGTDGSGADIAEPNDVVDFADLVGLLANWGPCPE